MNQNQNVLGQYASDHLIHADDPSLHVDNMGIKAQRGDGNVAMHHDTVLFDHVDKTFDEMTGRHVRMPSATEQHYSGEGIHFVSDQELQTGRRLGKSAMALGGNSAADRWMKENGHSWEA